MFNNITKKVLFIVAIALCFAFVFEVIVGRVTLSEANFMQIALIVLGGFFATKSNPKDPSDPQMGGMK